MHQKFAVLRSIMKNDPFPLKSAAAAGAFAATCAAGIKISHRLRGPISQSAETDHGSARGMLCLREWEWRFPMAVFA